MYYIKKLDNNKVIKNNLNNYFIPPPKNGRLTHIDPKFYTKCPSGCKSKVNVPFHVHEGSEIVRANNNNTFE
jgi:hypothetical protein